MCENVHFTQEGVERLKTFKKQFYESSETIRQTPIKLGKI